MARTETKIPPELKDAATQLIGLDERVLYLEEKYGTNEKLADAILETSKTQKNSLKL